ncbi:YihA family ribosome biogenesis GTP-binding protein [Litorivicinus lipolyticus]|uniref:Probable GTP-binding protein EngB n=1 Tax=Litorivicinus lipolyticus TaxID=418701 RepID=A0A5Q2Q8N0_9GAMM|nr:ribosome biogenesis GTP-binding protein YihA/YsxC [Litorivicinus lipolyticus]QGG79184.1 YihA family ribosome biogenesis GTP-binding protein [Litorivicinus lipolyticus]
MAFNLLRTAKYQISATKPQNFPADEGVEVAFAGRSNAGKSSCLNVIANQRALARVSKTPGRTQMINFFSLQDEQLKLVDLPGYGYAKVPVAMRANWGRNIQAFLENRRCLAGLVMIMDSRHPMSPLDQQMMDWALARQLPLHAVLTKADKLSRNVQNQTLMKVRKELPEGCTTQLFSALKRQGIEELDERLKSWMLPDASAPETE